MLSNLCAVMHHPLFKFSVAILGAIFLSSAAFAQDIVLHDVETTASDVKTIFKGKDYDVVVAGTSWDSNLGLTTGTYVTSVNGEPQASGEVVVDPDDPPSEVPVGTINHGNGIVYGHPLSVSVCQR